MSDTRPLETQENAKLREVSRKSSERVMRALERLQKKLDEAGSSICEEDDSLHRQGN